MISQTGSTLSAEGDLVLANVGRDKIFSEKISTRSRKSCCSHACGRHGGRAEDLAGDLVFQGANAHVRRTGSSPPWLMMTRRGSGRDGVAMFPGLELGGAYALALPASLGES